MDGRLIKIGDNFSDDGEGEVVKGGRIVDIVVWFFHLWLNIIIQL